MGATHSGAVRLGGAFRAAGEGADALRRRRAAGRLRDVRARRRTIRPDPDHYLPLLYVLGTRQRDEAIAFPVEGIDGGSVSMLAVRVG